MLILARGVETYARLQFNVGPESAQRLDVLVDYTIGFGASDMSSWQREYQENVVAAPINSGSVRRSSDCDYEDQAGDDVAGTDGCHLNERNLEPLFLDWEDDACQDRLPTIPV